MNPDHIRIVVTVSIHRSAIANRACEQEASANLLKAPHKLKGITYNQLVEKMVELGVDEKEANIRNKLSRGKFTAAFMLQCLTVAEVADLRL